MNSKKYLLDYAWLLGIALLIVLLDQATKEWVRNTLTYGEIYRPDLWLSRYARILHWRNTGSAFGLFQDVVNVSSVISVLSVIVSLAILYYFPQVPRSEWFLRLAMALQLGGAVGNLIDRLTIGHVTDFVSVGNFPVFNVADASISVGVAALILGMWLHEKRLQKEAQSVAENALAEESDPGAPSASTAP